MPWWKRSKPLAILLTITLLGFGLFELYYDLVGLPWPGMDFGYRMTAAGFGAFWVFSAFMLWRGAATMVTLSVLSATLMVAHGIMVILGGTKWGGIYLFAGIGLLALTALANEATREPRVESQKSEAREDRNFPRAA